MESSDLCSSCGSASFTRDDYTEALVCSSCGIVQEFDRFDAQIGGLNGPTGHFVRIGGTGLGNDYSYKERKIANAKKSIDELALKLNLSDEKLIEVSEMVSRITEGEFGDGNWFPVLIGACCYVVMRSDNKSLPIAEVSDAIGSDIYELGRMVSRVVEHLDLKLPEFDIVASFERAVKVSESFKALPVEQVEVMRKQGVFVLQCAVKWFLTTGRQPVPMVVAVLFFVSKLNKIGLRIDVLAKELKGNVLTCRKRYKELLETLVKVAQALPWGKDVTAKNIMANAHFVIRYMEMKAMAAKPVEKRSFLERIRIDMGEVVNECLKKDTIYSSYESNESYEEYDSKYYEVGDKSEAKSLHQKEESKIPHDSLAAIYKNFLNNVAEARSRGEHDAIGVKRKRDYDVMDSMEWWTGESELSQSLMLDTALDLDIGWDDALPPSYISGCKEYEKRKEKIKAVKLGIERVMNPNSSDAGSNEAQALCVPDMVVPPKETHALDWEDLIIEKLLLGNEREEEIEKGHYSTLLALNGSSDVDFKK
uniref:BRF2-like C-terminal domain-containing protein n=1 Tax=Kalanchoe fedtschenkoi TaxID=63787 RepID=A0A7N0T4I0_KALFE